MLRIIKLIIICTELSKNINGGYIERTKIVTPILIGQDKLAYLCTFDIQVQCFWRKNNRTMSIKPFEFLDKENVRNTTNCTIVAPKMGPGEKFKSENPKLQCHGFVQTGIERQHVTLGGSVKLECGLPKANRCTWKRSNKSILISDRYRYVNALAKTEKVTNCSIIIFNINAIDEGLWECSNEIIYSTTDTIKIAISYKLVFGDSNVKKPENKSEQIESLKISTETQMTTKDFPTVTTTMTRLIATNRMTTESTTKMFVENIAEVVSSQKVQEMELKIVILLSALGFIFLVALIGLLIYVVKRRNNNLRNLKKRSKMSACDRIVNDLYTVQDNRVSSRANTRDQLYSDSNSETYLVPIKLNADNDRRLYDVDHIYEEISEFVINNKPQPQSSNENNALQKHSSTIQSKPLPIPINCNNLDTQQ